MGRGPSSAAAPVPGGASAGDWLSTLQSPGTAVDDLPPKLALLATSEIELAWLAVALMHKSWLYENQRAATVNGALLSAFAGVGQSALELEILACLQTDEPDAGLARRHEALAQLYPILRRLVELLELPVHARLGKGEESERQQPLEQRRQGTLPTVAAQVVGWWSLFGNPTQLRRLVAAALRQTTLRTSPLETLDAKTIVQNRFGKLAPSYVATGAGPDHERTFTAVVSLDDGRRALGSGRSKKLAEKAAALALLLEHAPDALSVTRPPSDANHVQHAVQVVGREGADRFSDVAAMFGCRRRENFGLALTHRSWTYEFSKHLNLEGGSNALLALNGRRAFDLMFRRLRLLRLLQSNTSPSQEEAALTGLTDAEMSTMLDDLELRGRVRMGLGQRAHGLTIDIAANCVQALFGAALIEHRYVAAIERALPPAVASRLEAAVPLVTFDPFTNLIRLSAELGFAVTEVASVMHGPKHDQTCESTLALRHGPLTIHVLGEHSSRRGARKVAAATVMAALAVLNGASVNGHDPQLVAFLLRGQIQQLERSQHWTRWVDQGRLGASYLAAGDTAGYETWAAAAAATLETWHPDVAQSQHLAAYLRFAGGGGQRPKFSAALESSLDALDVLSIRDEVADGDLAAARSSVAALAAAHAVHLADRVGATLASLVDEWLLVSRRVVAATINGGGSLQVGPRSASAVTRILHEWGAALDGAAAAKPTPVSIALSSTSTTTGSISLQAGHPWTQALSRSMVLPLVLEAAPGCAVEAVDAGAVVLRVGDTAGRNWLTAPLLQAGNDAYEQEVARLLHDLKNELTAVATATLPRPGAGRSERLAQQLSASRHLDAVAALAVRLRAAGLGAWQHTEQGAVELDPFLRSYCADLMRSVPAHVQIVPPAASTVATVATTARVLQVILDNLTKNAVEAMPDGGQIRIDAIATDTQVLLEVADSGPGVPPGTLQALGAGRLASSTKRTGSGLGLASVQRLLRPLGGQLDWTTSSAGHTWLVLVPLDDQEAGEQ